MFMYLTYCYFYSIYSIFLLFLSDCFYLTGRGFSFLIQSYSLIVLNIT